jgi:hypothetical protein
MPYASTFSHPRLHGSRTRARRSLLVAALVIAVGVPAPALAQSTWTVVASPSPSAVASALQDVAIVAPDNVWAVGYSYSSSLAAYRTLTLRFDGTRWRTVSSPNSGAGYNQLDKVDATAANNVWALGSSPNGNLVERYDGTAWRIMPSPTAIGMRDLDVVSPTDVWAVGLSGSSPGVARWNGSSWKVIPSLTAASRHLMVFEAVSARASNDVWAVGWDRDYSISSRPVSSLVAHWNGSSWTRISSPSPLTRNILTDVTALSDRDVWAVGVAQTVSGGISERSLAMHWNGTSWTAVTPPRAEADSEDQLQAVTALSSTNVWAVGYYRTPGGPDSETLLLHWTSTGWTRNPSPNDGSEATLFGASSLAPGTIWAVGYNSPPGAANTTLTMRTTQG